MKKVIVMVTALVVIAAAYGINRWKQDNSVDSISDEEETSLDPMIEQQAVERARAVYNVQRADGVDFSDGPCLSDELMTDWVADIAHDPRLPIDDLLENQCPAFGKTAHHFVELDEDGEVIRAE